MIHDARQNYGLTAEDTFWCKQGILQSGQLRDSEDEEMIADIVASILLNEPLARSREVLDELYTPDSELFKKIEDALAVYSAERLTREIKVTFSVLRETVETYSNDRNTLRSVVNPGSANPIKAAFYAIFMSFFELVVRRQYSPGDPTAIMGALNKLHADMITTAHYTKTADRIKNIDKTTGLIQRHFVHREPPALTHGPGLALDFENSLRRSSIETARYEFKQGFLRLADGRNYEADLLNRLQETICAIANVGPESAGYIYIGVADTKGDAVRIEQLDGISPIRIGQRYVVGIDREVKRLGQKLEEYVEKLVVSIRSSELSEPLKTLVLSHIDIIEYRGNTVIRILIPQQRAISFLGNEAFTRVNSQTTRVQGKSLLALQTLFQPHR